LVYGETEVTFSGFRPELLEQPVPPELFSDTLPDWCFERFQRFAPLQQWLVSLLPGAE
jgi:hypothetical protein